LYTKNYILLFDFIISYSFRVKEAITVVNIAHWADI